MGGAGQVVGPQGERSRGEQCWRLCRVIWVSEGCNECQGSIVKGRAALPGVTAALLARRAASGSGRLGGLGGGGAQVATLLQVLRGGGGGVHVAAGLQAQGTS